MLGTPPTPDRIALPPLSVRAEVRPSSVNLDDRTIEVVFSTGVAVERYDWRSDQRYLETLSMKPADVRLERLNAGAPFLDSHSSWGVNDVLGVVRAAKVTSGKGTATIQLSRRDAVEPVWQDIRDGVLRNVSVGYRVHKYEQTDAADGQPMLRHAVDWEPYEISAVPMPADTGAQVRAHSTSETSPCVLVRAAKEARMIDDHTAQQPEASSAPQLMDAVMPNLLPQLERQPTSQQPNELDMAADNERARIQGILNGCEAARLPMSFARKLIEDKVSLVDAQGKILASLQGQKEHDKGPGEGPSGVRFVGADPLDNAWRGITDALLHKAAPQFFKLTDQGRPYRSRSMLAFAELCLQHRGVRTHDMTRDSLVGTALTARFGGTFHTTSDFANILVDAQNKILRAAYQEAPQTFAPIARRITIPDFKTMNVTQFGASPALVEVKEDGEFTRGTIGDLKETFALATYGRIFAISRKALINDDLEAFSSVPVKFGRAARNKESDLVWAQVTGNANMADGVALFSIATHANLASANAAIDIGPLGIGFAAMRIQKDLDALTPLNLSPRYLIVPVAKEIVARQFTTQITPALGGSVNPFSAMLQVIVEPRLDANSLTAWYLAAGSDQSDIILYGYLEGQDGPSVETMAGWNVDGLELKCRHDVAAKVVDWRPLFKNNGA